MGCYPPGWAGVVRGVYPPATMRTKLLRLSSFSSEPCVGTAETDMTSHRYEPTHGSEEKLLKRSSFVLIVAGG